MKPTRDEAPSYYFQYIDNVPDGKLLKLLESIHQDTQQLLKSINEEKGDFAYEIGKWSIKQVIQHLIDNERIMTYRALRFARNDKTTLPGYEQDNYAMVVNVEHKSIADLRAEYQMVRNTTIALYKHLTEEELERHGTASNNKVSVKALAYINMGHEMHHVNIIKERYL